MLTAPVTVKRTVWPDTGLPVASVTFAVTVCELSTGFVAVGGLSVHDAGGAGGGGPISPKIVRPPSVLSPAWKPLNVVTCNPVAMLIR